MKRFKKMMALVIAMVMCLAMGATVFAASIELTSEPEKFKDDHTYNVYEIFTGDIGTNDEGEQILQNVKYGTNYGDTGASVPKSVLDAVGTDARAYAASIVGSLHDNPVAQLTKDNSFKATFDSKGFNQDIFQNSMIVTRPDNGYRISSLQSA